MQLVVFCETDQTPDEESKRGQTKSSQSKVKNGYIEQAISLMNPDVDSQAPADGSGDGSFVLECKVNLYRFESSQSEISGSDYPPDLLGSSHTHNGSGNSRVA